MYQWEKRSLHIQQVILTVYLTVSWDNMEKSQRQSKRKLPVHTVFQLPAGTTLVLFCIWYRSLQNLLWNWGIVLSLQLTGGESEQLLAAPQHRHCTNDLLIRVWRCVSVHGTVYAYAHTHSPEENFPLKPVLSCSVPPALSSPIAEQGERSSSGSSMACHLPRGWDEGAGGGKILETTSVCWIRQKSVVRQAQQREPWVQSWSWGREQT